MDCVTFPRTLSEKTLFNYIPGELKLIQLWEVRIPPKETKITQGDKKQPFPTTNQHHHICILMPWLGFYCLLIIATTNTDLNNRDHQYRNSVSPRPKGMIIKREPKITGTCRRVGGIDVLDFREDAWRKM